MPTKVCLVKAMDFPVIMYGCESWTIKKTEHWRIAPFELWCWKRLLRIPWTARRSNQSILKEINVHWKDSWWSWNSSTLATSCEELTHWKRPWCWEGLGAGGEGDDRGWDGWMASPTWWTWVWVNSRSWWWTGRPGVLWFMGSQRVGHNWVTELNWTVTLKFLEARTWAVAYPAQFSGPWVQCVPPGNVRRNQWGLCLAFLCEQKVPQSFPSARGCWAKNTLLKKSRPILGEQHKLWGLKNKSGLLSFILKVKP